MQYISVRPALPAQIGRGKNGRVHSLQVFVFVYGMDHKINIFNKRNGEKMSAIMILAIISYISEPNVVKSIVVFSATSKQEH